VSELREIKYYKTTLNREDVNVVYLSDYYKNIDRIKKQVEMIMFNLAKTKDANDALVELVNLLNKLG
jgi:hypothetical protein